ncbi:MAG: hypothetical protein AAFQ74_07605 [Cyanobacteria bacterium J06623_4]
MKKTEMELQAIREKLAMLQAEQPVADVAAVPWSSPQQAARPFSQPAQPSQPTTEATPQALAIAALKQRSNNQGNHHSAQDTNGFRQEADRRMGELISQEIYRLEVMAQNINERSQQQAAEILAMKRSAQQAAVALRRQGIHDHPQLDIIEQFLEPYPSAAVPRLERNSSGEFCLTHATINLHSAEQEAAHTAQTLRNRQTFHSQGQSALFSQAISSGPEVSDLLDDPAVDYPTPISRRRPQQGWLSSLRRLTGSVGSDRAHTLDEEPAIAKARFSWMDAAIWFSAAAIARIMLEAIVVSFPFLRMPLLLVLFSVISFAIYRVFTAKSSDFTAAYRLGITLLGLFIGGSF